MSCCHPMNNQSRAAHRRAEEQSATQHPALLTVTRHNPPVIESCRWRREGCFAVVEWVLTAHEAIPVIPFDATIPVATPFDMDIRRCHYATCVYAPVFLRRLWGGV